MGCRKLKKLKKAVVKYYTRKRGMSKKRAESIAYAIAKKKGLL